MSENDDFPWNDIETIIVAYRDAVAVYPNATGNVSVRREQRWNEKEDAIIEIPVSEASAVADAILRAAAEISGAAPQEGLIQKTRDVTAAERQRRYRDRHRNGETHDGVTQRDDVTRNATAVRTAVGTAT